MLILFLLAGVCPLRAADIVEMQNGDRYAGKILSMDTNQLVIDSDVLGKITLPRGKVATVRLGQTAAPVPAAPQKAQVATTNAQPTPIVITNGTADLVTAFRQVGTNSPGAKAIREQYLLDAGPEANAKFDELLNGVMSGKVTINDLRSQAQTAANQLRSFKRELGDEGGLEVDGYLAILDHFLQETKAVTNAVPTKKPATTSPE